MILELFRSLVSMITAHAYTSAFVSGLIYEEVLAVTAAVSGRGDIPLWVLFVFGFFGIVIADIFWFYFIRIKPLFIFANKVSKWRKKALSKSAIGKFPPPTNLMSYMVTKTFWGLRTWGIFYCSVHGMTFKRFLLNTSITTIIWLAIFIPLARVIGKGIYFVFDLTKSIGIILTLVLIVLIGCGLLGRFAIKKLIKKN